MRALFWFLSANLLVTLAVGYQYVLNGPARSSFVSECFVHVALLSNFALLYLVLGVVFAPLVWFFPGRGRFVALVLPVVFALQVAVLVDSLIYRIFRFHFNGMVWNLVTTEGASDSVHLGGATFLTFGLVLAAAAAGQVALAWKLYGRPSVRPRRPLFRRPSTHMVVFLAAAVLADKSMYAASDLYNVVSVTRYGDLYPLYQRFTIKSFAEKVFHFRVDREETLDLNRTSVTLDYPKEALQRTKVVTYPNILWIAIDSWRYDMLNPEVTPNIAAFAQESTVFRNHYSGGNATRFGIFSLFYGCYGNYWHPFVRERRSPVFLDELQDLGYDFRIISSSRLTYPEFRKTCFVRMPGDIYDNLGGDAAVVKDPKGVKNLLDWIGGRESKRPFFSFLFLDAPHGNCSYPAEFEVFRPSRKTPNYLTVGKKDALPLFNSYRNAIRFDDHLVGEVLDGLRQRGLLETTIVLVTADHGEEFYESGYLGHTSAFSKQQTSVPLVLHVPGRGHAEVSRRTSHLDVVPTLLGLLGYTTPPEEYCQGTSLFAGAGHPFVISFGWNDGAIIDDAGTVVFSTEIYNASLLEIRDPRYRLLDGRKDLLKARAPEISEVLGGFRRFLR